jgi:hypothetical protein
MNGKSKRARTFGLIVMVAALAGACEKGEVLAPTDSTMTLTADKTEVVFGLDLQPVNVKLTAQVLASGGYPNQGVSVRFSVSTSKGTLASGGQSVVTNSDNVAQDTLTLRPDAPSSVTVTATSGDLSKTLTITTSSAACTNSPPVANAGADSLGNTKARNTPFPLDLDGSGSTDFGSAKRDSDHYAWDCGNGASGTATVTDHLGDYRYAQCTYTQTATTASQSWTVKLTVTNDGICDTSTPPICICKKSAVDTATVTNTPPTTP